MTTPSASLDSVTPSVYPDGSSGAPFQLAFEASPIAMFVATTGGRLLRANRAFAALLGYEADEIEALGWSAITHPDDRAASERLHREMEEGQLDQYQLEKRYRRRGGEDVWVLLTATHIGGVGGVDGAAPSVFVQVADISDRKRTEQLLRLTEERFALVGRATRDVVYDWDMVSGTLFWSDAMYGVLGHVPAGVRQDLDWWADQLHPDDRDRVSESLARAVAAGASFWNDEYRFRRGDGSWATVHDRGHLVRGDDGVAVRMIGAMADVTDRRELEAHLRQAQKMDAVGRLAGGIAHDFNNLLTIITSNCEMILHRVPEDERVASDVDEIREAAYRAAALTRQLLAFSRRQLMQPRVLAVNEVIADLEKMLRRVLGEHIVLRSSLAEDAGLVRADRNQLEQVLLNLAVNARDAMQTGGTLDLATAHARVDATAARMRDGFRPGEYVELRVSDTGTGMPKAVLARIFEPFFTTKEVGKGTGLGLSTVYGIVKQSNGFVYADSEPGKGTTFRVYLPRLEEGVEELPLDDGRGAPAEEPRDATILLVEDDPGVRTVVARALESRGYRVLTAAGVREALELEAACGDTLDAVLADVVMPGRDGHALAFELRQRRPTLPVLLMSGYPGEHESNVSTPWGPVLQKPLSPEILTARLDEVIARRAATAR